MFPEPDSPFVLKGGLGVLARTTDARDAQARQYRKLAEHSGIPDRFHDINNVEALAKGLIEPCLSG